MTAACAVGAARAASLRLEAERQRAQLRIARTEEHNRISSIAARQFRAKEAADLLEWRNKVREERSALEAAVFALPRGQVIALASRRSGDNGLFSANDVGVGRCLADGMVEILWANSSRTRTRTSWPNKSWYMGHPFTASEISEGVATGWLNYTGFSDASTTDDFSTAAASDISEITAFLEEVAVSDVAESTACLEEVASL